MSKSILSTRIKLRALDIPAQTNPVLTNTIISKPSTRYIYTHTRMTHPHICARRRLNDNKRDGRTRGVDVDTTGSSDAELRFA